MPAGARKASCKWGEVTFSKKRIIIKRKRRCWARCTAASRATVAAPVSLSCAVCKCFAIKSVEWRMTGTFDAAWLFSGVPAESYFHRMLCMHFSDRLLQETGSSGGEQTRLEWITTPSRQNEAKHNSGRQGGKGAFIHSECSCFCCCCSCCFSSWRTKPLTR